MMNCHNGQGYQTIPNVRIPATVYMGTVARDNQGNGHVYIPQPIKKKSILEAYLLAIVLGPLGAHHFYLNRPFFGLFYFFTLGMCGIGWLFDLLRLPCLVADANERLENPEFKDKRRTDDAYLIWFVFGLLGFQHFYLKRPSLGFLYFFTLGIFGLGWLRDVCFLPSDVRRANREKLDNTKSIAMTYAFNFWFTGILGGHHFYLRRYLFGIVYFFTFGLGGVGYLIDLFRVPILVRRANETILTGIASKKTIDDAYLLWFPLGFLGLHHFYLNRPVWGLVYFFTFGLFFLGWFVDLVRIPSLVRECNAEMESSGRFLPTNQGYVIQPPPPHQEEYLNQNGLYPRQTYQVAEQPPPYYQGYQQAVPQAPPLSPSLSPPSGAPPSYSERPPSYCAGETKNHL